MKDSNLAKGYILKGTDYSYRIEGILGQGSFGITYLATTKIKAVGGLGSFDTEIKVAVKEFFMHEFCSRHADGTVTEMSEGSLVSGYARKFRKEAENLAKLSHPGIVKVLEVFEANNTCYYSMEYIDGGSLDAYVKQNGGLPEDEATECIRQIADALGYMHRNKMLHLDLKPLNVMRSADGSRLTLIDFGLSKQYSNDGNPESSTSIGLGTLGYAPIEQSKSDRDKEFAPTLDVYALGATFFKLLTGQTPPDASDVLDEGLPVEKLQQKGVSQTSITAIERAMEPRKSKRVKSVREFVRLLQSESVSLRSDEETQLVGYAQASEPAAHPQSHPVYVPEYSQSPSQENVSKKPWTKYCVIGGVSIFAVLILAFLLTRGKQPVPVDSILVDGVRECVAEFESAGVVREFDIEKNFDDRWTYSGVPEWCTAKAVEGKIVLNVSENRTAEDRIARIEFKRKGGNDILASLTLNQNAGAVAQTQNPAHIALESITLSKTALTMEEGETSTLSVRLYPKNATDVTVTWKSTDVSVAKVNTSGKVSAVKAGNATVIVTCNGKEASCKIIVKPKGTHTSTDMDQIERIDIQTIENTVVEEEPQEEEAPFMVVAKMPEFPGGTAALMDYLRKNIKYPQECRVNNIQGRVLIQFVVNNDGSIVDPEVVKSVNPYLDKEALRVIAAMPKWSPGEQRGKPVRVKYTVPVNFKLNDDSK